MVGTSKHAVRTDFAAGLLPTLSNVTSAQTFWQSSSWCMRENVTVIDECNELISQDWKLKYTISPFCVPRCYVTYILLHPQSGIRKLMRGYDHADWIAIFSAYTLRLCPYNAGSMMASRQPSSPTGGETNFLNNRDTAIFRRPSSNTWQWHATLKDSILKSHTRNTNWLLHMPCHSECVWNDLYQ